MSRALRILGLAAGAAALLGSFTSVASADPGTTPAKTDIVGVGSDTTEDVLNFLASGYNGKSPAPANKLASWDAFGSVAITPAFGCAEIPRPAGSGAGVAALRNNTDGCIDFARSSSGPKADQGDLVFVPFAKDILTYAYNLQTNAIKNLTAAELKLIYTCQKQTWNGVRPNQGFKSEAILPRLPQSGSGTRSTFLSAIGVTEADIVAAKKRTGCNLVDTVAENDPAVLKGKVNAIAPFSLARYRVAGGYKTTGIDLSSSQSTGYRFERNVYNVLKDTVGNNTVPAAFKGIFGKASEGGYICSTAGQDLIKARGFSTISNCGTPVATPAG